MSISATVQARDSVGVVGLLYQAILSRAPEQGGLDYFVNLLETGQASQLQVIGALLSSSEFGGLTPQATIEALYTNVLGRAAEPAGLNYWLNSGLSLPEIVANIALSNEAFKFNANGLARLEQSAIAGNVGDGSMDLDNSPNVVTVIKEVPGPTQVVTVTVPGPVVDKPDVKLELNGDLDAKFVNPTNGLLFGDGTTPNNGHVVVADPTSGAVIGLSVMPRQAQNGDKYIPISSNFDGTTAVVSYNVPSGPQSIDNGSFANNANRGAVNTNFTFGTEGDLTDFITAGGKLEIKFDQDGTTGVSHLVLNAFVAGDGTVDFAPTAGPGAITDSGGNEFAVANSQQQNFYLPGGVAALTPGAQFTNEFNIYDAAGVKLVGVTEILNYGAPGYSPADQLV